MGERGTEGERERREREYKTLIEKENDINAH